MTRVYTGSTFASIYRKQLIDLVENPEYIVTVRGRPTREILNVVTEIINPRARCQIVPGRKLNPWLALSESLWLLAGRNDVASLLPYNKNITRFSDDNKTLYGAYGYRTFDQIPKLIQLLRENSNSRRAVLQIWTSEDLNKVSNDLPCNQQVMFKVRDEKLHMTVTCRSNDLHWGLAAVNTFQFGILQEYIAARLGVGMGTQTHFSNSLHIYTDKEGQRITDAMLAEIDKSLGEHILEVPLFPSPFPNMNHNHFAMDCGWVLDDTFSDDPDNQFLFFEFAADFLRDYRLGNKNYVQPLVIRHYEKFNSWIAMGQEFKSK